MTRRRQRRIRLGFSQEKMQEGGHIVYVYSDDSERKRTMARFLRQGLLDGEKVLYLVDDISPDEMRKELMELGVDVDECQKDFDLTEGHYARCPGRIFSSEFMLGIVAEYYEDAIAQGYAGARGAGEMNWAAKEGRATLSDLVEYEAKLNGILRDHPLTTVCQYDARRFDGALIMDLLSVHPLMIVRGQLVKNPHCAAPEEFLRGRGATGPANGFDAKRDGVK